MLIQQALLLLAAGQVSPQMERDAKGVPFFIDSRVQGYARQVLRKAMSNLAPADRENVVFVDLDDHPYANRPSLLREIYQPKKIGRDRFLDDQGEPFVAPPFPAKPQPPVSFRPMVWPPAVYAGSGPYRQVYSKVPASATAAGSSWESATIHLPGSTNISIADPTSETAFVYMGGWGGTGSGGAVDAGWQYSSVNNNWSAVVRREGSAQWSYATRYNADQDVNLKFYAPADNQVAIAWTATPYPTGTRIQRTMTFAMGAGYGWKANGNGCILKRMTSIGQDTEDFTTGSYIHNTHWSACLLGTSSTSNAAWGATNTGGFFNYPNTTVVATTYVSQSDETDNVSCNQ